MEAITKRLSVWGEILWRPWWLMLGVAWTLFSNLATLRDNLLPEEAAKRYGTLKLLPKWGWKMWALGILGIIILMVLESAYRAIQKREFTISSRDKEMLALKASPAEMTPRIHRLYINRIDNSATDWGLTSKAYAFDLFIEGDCDLLAPIEIVVNRYELQMTGYHSDTHTPAGIEDMRDWALIVHKAPSIGLMNAAINDKLTPMPQTLFSNVPNPGWLHFRTDIMLEDDLANCNMILIIYTGRGNRSSPRTSTNVREKHNARAIIPSRYLASKS